MAKKEASEKSLVALVSVAEDDWKILNAKNRAFKAIFAISGDFFFPALQPDSIQVFSS